MINPLKDILVSFTEKEYRTLENMERYGGSFVQKLAALARQADATNLKKIKETWPEYWDVYSKKV